MMSLLDTLAKRTLGAFNFNDQFDLAGIMAAANHVQEPVVALVSSNAVAHSGIEFLHDIFRFFQSRSSVPLYIELDHTNDVKAIERALDLGVDAVMADFSHLPYDENVLMTSKISEMASGTQTLVEGEVEHIGTCAASPTSVERITDFVAGSGVQLVAPRLGTVHGFNRYPPALDRDSIAALCGATSASVVAHGADFLSSLDIKELVATGVAKINFGPELRDAVYQATIAWTVTSQAECPDHRQLTKAWKSATKAQALMRLREIQSA
jgi:fructose/tagatose bisphosphate aldolase